MKKPLRTPRGAYYPLTEFLDDQRRVLEALGCVSERDPESDRAADGGYLVFVCLDLLNRIPHEARRKLTRIFCQRYGPALGVVRQERFFRMIRFVAEHAAEIEQNGFGRFDSITKVHKVHEELVKHLLNFAVPSPSNVIPFGALRQFYDHWGARWF